MRPVSGYSNTNPFPATIFFATRYGSPKNVGGRSQANWQINASRAIAMSTRRSPMLSIQRANAPFIGWAKELGDARKGLRWVLHERYRRELRAIVRERSPRPPEWEPPSVHERNFRCSPRDPVPGGLSPHDRSVRHRTLDVSFPRSLAGYGSVPFGPRGERRSGARRLSFRGARCT